MPGTLPLPSIRNRLSRSLLVMSLAWGVMVSLTVGVMLHRALDVLLDQGLQESAEILYGLVQGGLPEGKSVDGMLAAPPHQEALVWQLVDHDNQVLFRSHRAPREVLSDSRSIGFSQSAEWRVYTLLLPDDKSRLQVAQLEPARHVTQWEILGGSIGVTLLVGLLSTLWLYRRLGRELAPLQDLSEAVARYNPLDHDAATQLPEPARAELVSLIKAVDDLGRRLAARVAHERAFAAHAAHALRTPLAGMDAQLAVAMREAPVELRPRLTQTREAATRLRTVVTALISLFRAGGQMHWQQLDLPELMARLPVRGMAVNVACEQPIWADADLLSAALMNLLDNAVRHRATEVKVTVEASGKMTLIRLFDNGTGVDLDRVRLINAAFRSHEPGDVLGLGLTLTDLVARTHGGDVKLVPITSPDGSAGGVEVQLRLGPPPKPAPSASLR